MSPWVDFCYGHTSSLVLSDGSTIESSRGIQQGDPMGPALFALAIQPLITKAKQATMERFGNEGVDVIAFYLDDGVVAGDHHHVKYFLDHLVKGLDGVGLKFEPAKSWVVPTARDTRVTPGNFEGYRWTADGNFHLLGAPIGTKAWCTEHTGP